jgi:hypothetical protein
MGFDLVHGGTICAKCKTVFHYLETSEVIKPVEWPKIIPTGEQDEGSILVGQIDNGKYDDGAYYYRPKHDDVLFVQSPNFIPKDPIKNDLSERENEDREKYRSKGRGMVALEDIREIVINRKCFNCALLVIGKHGQICDAGPGECKTRTPYHCAAMDSYIAMCPDHPACIAYEEFE